MRESTQALATVVLRHAVAGGVHFDWMIVSPGRSGEASSDGEARVLATWRIELPPGSWREAGRFEAERLGDHRAAYLRYEGPVSGDRGEVKRVDEGEARAERWDANRVRVGVSMRGFIGGIELRRIVGSRWEAQVLQG